ncbi:peptidase C15 [Methylobacterium sp.]|uniref:pyroglutamyl-peptidase I family protein n=1 Tax=Methylobacterium sp. TaxID=409 RepID=UPI00258A0467|nr:peptidase C15 [Methylobacterium sp.]
MLITAFGPFPGMPVNPSEAVARLLARSPRLALAAGGRPALRILPTAYAALATHLDPALAEAPAAVLMIGVAGRSRRVRVEMRAVNRASRLFPDAGGRLAAHLTLEPEGPFQRRAGPAAVKALARLRGRIPVRSSRDAGRYLCNASYYRALAGPVPVLFLHIPRPPRSGARAWAQRLAAAFAEVAVLLLREARGRTGVPPR